MFKGFYHIISPDAILVNVTWTIYITFDGNSSSWRIHIKFDYDRLCGFRAKYLFENG